MPSPERAGKGWIRRLLPWLRPHRRNAVIAFSAALVGGAIAAAVPAIEREIVDKVIIKHHSSLALWLGALCVAAVATFVASHVRRYVGGRVSLDVQFDLRNAIYDQVQRLDFARHDELQTGQLVSRANSDVGLLQGLLSFLPIMSGNVLLLVSSLAVMFALSPLLASISMVVVPLLTWTAYRMRQRTFPSSWDSQQKEGEVAVVVEEAVTGVRVVKGFGQEKRELDRLVERATALYRSRMRAVRYQARYQPVLQSIPVFGEVAVLALGGRLTLDHSITVGTFLAFATYLLQLASPARMLAGVLIVGQQARAGAERVLDLLDSNPLVADQVGAPDLPPVAGRISFEGVRFGYLRSKPVLDGLDLSVAPGEKVALVGASGSGKSTVALLLPRFYDVQAGSVRIDGTDVRDVTVASIRRQVGVVFEESFLFSDTVRANIAYARPDASDAEVERAARAAEAHGFISALPGGYSTVVGERGLTLSGGQRQRIALARALLSDPGILVLDDATSAVDARVEAGIHDTLRSVMEGRTTLLVAHRRSTLRLADRIAVVEGGRVVDQGTHEQLMGRCETYRLLLSGPGEDCEGGGATAVEDEGVDWAGPHDERGASVDLEAEDGAGLTPELWPYDHIDRPGMEGAATSPAGGRAALGAEPGRHGGGGSWMGGIGPSPELLELVEALPPAVGDPRVDVDAEAAYDRTFSLRRFLRPYRFQLAAGLALVVVDALATLAGPLLIREGLDSGVARGSLHAVWVASALFLLVAALDLADSVWQVLLTGRTAERLLLALRIRIWAQLQRLSIDFYERDLAGRIMTRMTTDVDAFSTLLQSGLISAIVAMLTLVGVGIAMVLWSVELGLVALSVVIPLAVATLAYRKLSARAYAKSRDRIAVVNATMQESLSGVRETQAFLRERHNERRFRALTRSYLESRLAAQRLVATYFPFVELLADVAAVLVLGVGSVLIARRSLTAGELVGFLLYLDLFFNPIQQLSQTFDSYQQAGASMAKIRELMAERPLVEPSESPFHPGRLEGRIAFDGVWFSYPTSPSAALQGVDFSVEPGETVALVGETGAGKSTIVRLLTRFYDPTRGAVLVDGLDLRDIDPDAYHAQLGYVPQEPFLFSGTIRDNIAYGRPSAGDAEVEAAARAVGAHDLVAGLAGGYLHRVTERGRSLSVGQRQLVALARALLVDPAVLLLDEATSNLDLATEAAVVRAMGAVASGRTTVLIAHRLQTARRADRIIVMERGRVAEQGTHAGLLARRAIYAEMWRAFEDSHGEVFDAVPAPG